MLERRGWGHMPYRYKGGKNNKGRVRQSDQRSPMTLISSVHTLLIHTLSFPSTPSTPSSSTPSHQHLRAGFRQKRSSFCAIPTALFPSSFPRISVRNRARARLQMTALFGSFALWPQWSLRLKPLFQISSSLLSDRRAYPAVSISIRCCSVVPGSSLRRNPEKIPSCFNSALPAALFTSIISGCSIPACGGMT